MQGVGLHHPWNGKGWRHQLANLLGQDVPEKVLISEEVWITTTVMSLEGNVFPTLVVSHHRGQSKNTVLV